MWQLPALEEYYQNEILSSRNETGFDYTYGERLRAYMAHDYLINGILKLDQIEMIIQKLRKYRTTRRAVAATWQPLQDTKEAFHPPCLMALDFLMRGEQLHLTAFFRSHDIYQAWPANAYGLSRLMEYVSDEIGKDEIELESEIGTLTTISCSAHIYI